MTKRKIILLVSCAVLLCIYIVQITLASRSSGKTVSLDDKTEIDKIEVSMGTGEYTLSKEGDDWVISSAKYPASMSAVDSMIGAIKSIKVLEKVGKINAASNLRYALDGEKAITVKAFSNGALLRKIAIGKNTATSSQTYAALDDASDVCLVSGNLHDTFDKTISDLRSRIIYKLDEDTLKKVSVTYNEDTLSFEKAADSPEWSAADGRQFDSDKVSSWAQQLYSLSASQWLDDDAAIPGEKVATARVESADDFATVEIYKAEEDAVDEDGKEAGKAKYYCTSSATPYKAEISSYTAQKYMKSAADFAKDDGK